MRWTTLLTTGFAAALIGGAGAWADSPWYVSGSVGGVVRQDKSVTDYTISRTFIGPFGRRTLTATGTNRFTYDAGPSFDIALGYHASKRLRIEGDVGYFNYTGNTVSPFTTSPIFPNLDGHQFSRASGGSFSRFTSSMNAIYDLPTFGGRFTPFIGTGLGVSVDRSSDGHYVDASGSRFVIRGSAFTSAFGTLQAGVNIGLSKNWSLTPTYRFVDIFTTGADNAHIAELGLRYQF